jgi:hypothetical protein
MMKAAGFGFSILTAMTLVSVSFICYAFVNDTDAVHIRQDVHISGNEIVLQMGEVVDHWEGGLKATGGALNPIQKLLVSYQLYLEWEEMGLCDKV